jgi:hypothetical protein
MDPPKEARMPVANPVWRHKPPIVGVDVVRGGGVARQRLLPSRSDLSRHGTPDWTVADDFKVVKEIVEHPIAERTKLPPVVRIKRA